MKNIHTLVAALALSATAVSVTADQGAPAVAPYAPFAMPVQDPIRLAEQQQAFYQRQATMMQQVLEAQRRLAEQMAAEQTRLAQAEQQAIQTFFDEQMRREQEMLRDMQRPPAASAPFALPMAPQMPEMSAPMALTDLPQSPAFADLVNLDPQARRAVMTQYHKKLRAAMKQQHATLRQQAEARREESRKQRQERLDIFAKERAKLAGSNV